MNKKSGSGSALLACVLLGQSQSDSTAVITHASVDGINLLSTIYNKDADDGSSDTHLSPIEIISDLTIDYPQAGVRVVLKAPLRAMLEDSVVISSISTMVDTINTERFWFADINKRFTVDSASSVRVMLTSIDAFDKFSDTDLKIEEGTGYDPSIAGWIDLTEDDIALVSRIYTDVLNEPAKHKFLLSDMARVVQEIKDEAIIDLESNID